MDKFFEFLPLIVFFFTIPYIVKLSLDYNTRKKLIEKGIIDENIKYLYFNKTGENGNVSLKWGMVTLAIGIAFLIGIFAPDDYDGKLHIALVFIFGGLALILYYFIESKLKKGHDDRQIK
jgi:hypothetical protein